MHVNRCAAGCSGCHTVSRRQFVATASLASAAALGGWLPKFSLAADPPEPEADRSGRELRSQGQGLLRPPAGRVRHAMAGPDLRRRGRPKEVHASRSPKRPRSSASSWISRPRADLQPGEADAWIAEATSPEAGRPAGRAPGSAGTRLADGQQGHRLGNPDGGLLADRQLVHHQHGRAVAEDRLLHLPRPTISARLPTA